MRHRLKGRHLGRSPSHRRAMFRNMAASLIKSVVVVEGDATSPKVPGRIVTTLHKAKELRPFIERLVTMARKSLEHEARASEHATTATRNTTEWENWRKSEKWNSWNQAIAPAIAYRRRAFSQLRDKEAVSILFDVLANRFADRPGGYTRVIRLAKFRLGDAGRQAVIEFVGERDRVRKPRRSAPVVRRATEAPAAAPTAGGEAPAAAPATDATQAT